ncbi:von Willebrand factor A domain-containing protein 5A-like [Bradysia coprophila]|uniref:von Willebrand factor A domain-containing protein 5A-like n=1 Tax=Bradysia coprophila TaxID=38358 RepID=UPI00187DD2B5|nr:von Willebrand factor A domain-containing protein 5A-like [Bradysia coprophila]
MFTNSFGEYKNISCGLVSMVDAAHPDVYPIPLLSVYVTALVLHAVAQVEITQNYVNKEEQPIEAIYYFPIDPDGAVTNFRVELDDRMIKGVVKPREEAQEAYDEAVANRTTAFLGEETKADMFKLRVGSLRPGSRVKVTIEYVTEVKNEPGTNNIRFYIPTTIAPRYISAEETDRQAMDIRNMTFSQSSPVPLSMRVDVSIQGGIKSIVSPTHTVTVEKSEATTYENDDWQKATVELSGQTTDMDRDFVIIIEPREKHKPRLYSETSDNGNGTTAVMIHLLPSFKLDEQKTELIFVLDRSGSMLGPSIRSAKEALTLFLHSMPVDCYFNVLGFGSSHEFLFPASVKYDDDSLRMALKHATELDADLGGTEIFEPLKALYEKPSIDGYSKQFFILTDGEVYDTDRVLGIVKANAHKVRVFTLGIGDAASHYLVEGVATAGGGTAVFVNYNESMDKKVINQLKNALQPSLFNVTIKWDESATDDVPERQASDVVVENTLFGYNKPIESEAGSESYLSGIRQSPKKVRPVYDGSQLLVLGIFKNGCPKSVLITAHTPDGPLTVKIEHSTSNNLDGNGNLLHRLAAIKLIRELEMEVSSLQSKNSEAEKILKNEIIEIGCQNGIASRYTSFIASDVRNDKQSKESWVMVTRHVPSQIAHGWHGGNRMGVLAFPSHGSYGSGYSGSGSVYTGSAYPGSGYSGIGSSGSGNGYTGIAYPGSGSSGSGYSGSGSVYTGSAYPGSGYSGIGSSGSGNGYTGIAYPGSGSSGSGYSVSGSGYTGSTYPESGYGGIGSSGSGYSGIGSSGSGSVYTGSTYPGSRYSGGGYSGIGSSGSGYTGSGYSGIGSGGSRYSGSGSEYGGSVYSGIGSGGSGYSEIGSIGSGYSGIGSIGSGSSGSGYIGSGSSGIGSIGIGSIGSGISESELGTTATRPYQQSSYNYQTLPYNYHSVSGIAGSSYSANEEDNSTRDNAALGSSSTLMLLISLQSYDGSFTLNEALSQILGKTLQELKAGI